MHEQEKVYDRIIFLDYDGVVNTPMWNKEGTRCDYSHPFNGRVNNFQAVQWLSEICQKFGYNVVVTSTWRKSNNYKDCLVNGGLRKGIEVIGRTKDLWREDGDSRGDEIKEYLTSHPEIKFYLIIDDEDVPLEEHRSHFIQTNGDVGITLSDYIKAENIIKEDILNGGSFHDSASCSQVGIVN